MNHRKYLHTPIALISVAYEMNSFCNSPQTIYVGVPQKSLFDVGWLLYWYQGVFRHCPRKVQLLWYELSMGNPYSCKATGLIIP